jgi:uncharacterized protein YceK
MLATAMNILKLIPLIIAACLISGCGGTMITRQNYNGCSIIGGYPYKAVVYDVSEMGFLGYCCLPFDLVIDTVGLPFDLIAWPFGLNRPYPPYEYKEAPRR